MALGNKITVFGCGRLGICFALVMEKAGYDVLGVDIFPSYVDALNNKTFKSHEPNVSNFLKDSKNFRATTDIDEGIKHSNIYFIFVDTPCTGNKKYYDVSKLSNVISNINQRMVKDSHVIIGCTVIPGYIAEVGRQLLEDCTNTTLSYNPEFIAQGDIINGLLKPDMVLIGEGSAEIGEWLADAYCKHTSNTPNIKRMSPESAEITKLALNCFVTMKIAYANLVGDVADLTPNANKDDILNAVGSDSRIGLKCIRPGWGFGGPCFPRDNRAFGKYCERVGVNPVLSTASDQANDSHADFQAEQMLKSGQKEFTFDDVCYKPKCPQPITEESQKLIVAEKLARAGRTVTIRDRAIVIQAVKNEYGNIFKYETEQ